jgi:hypothetical protein
MDCAEVQRILPELDDAGRNGEFGAHLKSCPVCSELVADLLFISSESRQLSAAEEPPARVWVRIAAQLREEGIIREPQTQPAPLAIPQRRLRAWWLVPVAAALLAGATYVVSHRPTATIATQNPPAVQTPTTPAPAPQAPATQQPETVAQSTPPRPPTQKVAHNPSAVEPGPSIEDQQFLSEVSQRAPSMRATYEDQLGAVNAYIQQAQAYLDQNPDDEEARLHLMEAYRQKALLYQLALDHIQ